MRHLIILTLAAGLLIAGCSGESGDPLAPTGVAGLGGEKASPRPQLVPADVAPMARTFQAHLTGDEEVPEAVETRAHGQAVFRLSRDGTMLHYRLMVANIDDVIGAHIHMASAGENGPIVLPLFGDPFVEDAVTLNGPLAEGTASAEDVSGPLEGDFEGLIAAMREGDAYVNVHTLAFPPGEIRGQIR